LLTSITVISAGVSISSLSQNTYKTETYAYQYYWFALKRLAQFQRK